MDAQRAGVLHREEQQQKREAVFHMGGAQCMLIDKLDCEGAVQPATFDQRSPGPGQLLNTDFENTPHCVNVRQSGGQVYSPTTSAAARLL